MRSVRILGVLLAGSTALLAQSFNFLPGSVYPTGNGPLVTASGDFNGDGKLDLAVGNGASNTVSIYMGNGDGSFTPGPTISLPGCPVAFLSAADFTRSGHTGLLAVCELQTALWVVPGQSGGSFGTPVSTTLPQIAFIGLSFGFYSNYAVTDFNGDGIPDLVLGLGDASVNLNNTYAGVLLGKGDGTFLAPVPIYTTSTAYVPSCVAAADFNRDGNQDVVVMANNYSVDASKGEVFLGTGKGGFEPPKSVAVSGQFAVLACAAADLNRDGNPDLILSLGDSTGKNTGVAVYLGAGDGTFSIPRIGQTAVGQGILAFAVGDLRGTGTPDLVEIIGSTQVDFALQLCAGNGDGTFQNPVPLALPSGLVPWWQSLSLGDWTDNGIIGLALTAMPAGFKSPGKSTGTGVGVIIAGLETLPAGDLVVYRNGITPAPALAVSKTQLQFAYAAGGTAPPAQSVAISNSGTGTLNWSAISDSSWLTVSPASGTGAGNLSISISPPGLTPATYTGHIKVSANGAASSPQSVTVTLTISAPSTAPVITAVVNGASFQPGIESGSWVTILGSNLSNTNPARIWKASEIVNGNLPQALDGTGVTIDGKPAFVYYVSPTQLNVQAPTDSATGSVAVVVTNNSQMSVPFNASLEAESPAFFLYPGTSNPIVSRFPDYGLVGTANAPAHPGDVLILWATGFGPTNPTTPAGIVVTGAPAAATKPVITIGTVQVPVSAAVLTPGSAGLYQIAIQLPANVPTGTVAIQAAVGGALSPAGTTIVVQ